MKPACWGGGSRGRYGLTLLCGGRHRGCMRQRGRTLVCRLPASGARLGLFVQFGALTVSGLTLRPPDGRPPTIPPVQPQNALRWTRPACASECAPCCGSTPGGCAPTGWSSRRWTPRRRTRCTRGGRGAGGGFRRAGPDPPLSPSCICSRWPHAPMRLLGCPAGRAPWWWAAARPRLFAALTLAQAGAQPILIERGRGCGPAGGPGGAPAPDRPARPGLQRAVWRGGAGTFSDNKLTTGIKDPRMGRVIEAFCRPARRDHRLPGQAPHRHRSAAPGGARPARAHLGPGRAGALRHPADRAGGAPGPGGRGRGVTGPGGGGAALPGGGAGHRPQRQDTLPDASRRGGGFAGQTLRRRRAHRAPAADDRPQPVRRLAGHPALGPRITSSAATCPPAARCIPSACARGRGGWPRPRRRAGW